MHDRLYLNLLVVWPRIIILCTGVDPGVIRLPGGLLVNDCTVTDISESPILPVLSGTTAVVTVTSWPVIELALLTGVCVGVIIIRLTLPADQQKYL